METTLALENKLDELKADFKAKWEESKSATGAKLTELYSKMEALQKQADALDVTLAERHVASTPGADPSLELKQLLEQDDGLQSFMRTKAGSVVLTIPSRLLESKTTIDSNAVGFSTSGVLPIDRTVGIVPEARQALRIRDLLRARPTQLSLIDFVKVNSGLQRASVQTESSLKFENSVTFTTGTARVETHATTIPVSRQIFDDLADLMAYLQVGLPYVVDLEEEVQFLTGSGTGTDLNGMVTQATGFNGALLPVSPGWNRSDIISAAIEQIQIAKEVDPSFVVLHPVDYWLTRRSKNTLGSYLFAGANASDPFWGLVPVVTTSVGQGTFLVGSGNPAAVEIRDRMETVLEVSNQHSDFFARNMLMLRAERRSTLCVYRANSFITGNFSTSP